MVLGKNNFTRRGVKATKPISFLYEFLNLRLDVNYLDPMNNPENDVPSYFSLHSKFPPKQTWKSMF